MSYTAKARKWDHELVIGDTYRIVVTLKSAGVAYDITGATGTCEIRTEVGGTLLASPTVSLVTDGTDGQFQAVLAYATTATLTAQRAQYSARILFADGDRRTIIEGVVDLRKSVVA
jgi:hypothetical protein